MALVSSYAGVPARRAVDVLVLSHFDGHGVSFAAARARVLQGRGQTVEVVSKFPETGPRGLSDGTVMNLINNIAPKRIEVIDIPIDVRNPDAAIDTLAKMAQMAPVYYYDHHETDVPFIPRLHQNGIIATVFGDNVAMAAGLELLTEDLARELAIIGTVADRDSAVLKLVDRETVENNYLPVANRLDVVVRRPMLIGADTPGDVAKMLAEQGPKAIPTGIDYPPETLAREVANRIIEQGQITVLVDWRDQPPQASMWVPKTLEQLLLRTGRYIAVAVVPGYNPRTRTIEGYDVRVLKYWLAPPGTPTPEQVARELIQRQAIQGNVVGHADYISLRYGDENTAMAVARTIYRRIEGQMPATATLINDTTVATAVRRDFQTILERLTEILEAQQRMYAEYLELKKRQVELLEETRRHEYD